MGNRFTVARNLGSSEHINNTKRLVNALEDMLAEIRNKMYPGIICEDNMKWLMTFDTFNWIIANCEMEYGFTWQMELSYTERNRYTMMGVEIEFVNYEEWRGGYFVELTCREPDKEAIKSVYNPFGISVLPNASFVLHNGNGIEVRKENKTMPIYIGYGKKVTIENVIFNNPATIVFWSDGTKTVVKRQKGDKKFDPEKGLAMAICKKVMGNKGNFNDIFKEWIEED